MEEGRTAPRLAAALKARRDALPEIAGKYYLHLAERADVYLTDQPDLVEAKRPANGDLEVTVSVLGATGNPGSRTSTGVFHRNETDDVRLYALGGDDRIVVTGPEGTASSSAPWAAPGNDVARRQPGRRHEAQRLAGDQQA